VTNMKFTVQQTEQWLAARLETLGLTQLELAQKADLSAADVSRYKQHKQRPSIDGVEKLARALKVNVVELLIALGAIDPDATTTPTLVPGKKNSKVIWSKG